jgi:hypothetical protein
MVRGVTNLAIVSTVVSLQCRGIFPAAQTQKQARSLLLLFKHRKVPKVAEERVAPADLSEPTDGLRYD